MPQAPIIDDLGFRVEIENPPARIISLVPSWTETLFTLGLGDRVVGATKFCVEPADRVASVKKIGGTKNPDLRAIFALAPDLVVANAEENRREDVERMRAHGLAVLTTYPRTVPAAVESLLKIGRAAGCEPEAGALARDITRSVSEVEANLGVWSKLRLRAFCPIWKKPWMAFNADTYSHMAAPALSQWAKLCRPLAAHTPERQPWRFLAIGCVDEKQPHWRRPHHEPHERATR